MLSIPERTFREWTKNKRDELKRERDKKIFDLWLACHTQEEIAGKTECDQSIVSDIIKSLWKTAKLPKFIKISLQNFMMSGTLGN